MSTIRRMILILALVVVVLCGAAFTGVLNAARWNAGTDSTVAQAYGSSDGFAPTYAPTGNWQVFIDAPAGIRRPLEASLKRELPGLTASQCTVEFVTAVPVATAGINRISLKLTPDALWTPVAGKFADKAEIRIVTAGATVPPDDLTIVVGGARIDVTYAVAAKGFGLVGRPQMDAYRAQIATDFIIKEIRETYDDIRGKAGQ